MIPPTDAVLNSISQEFPYRDVQEATCGFSSSRKLGAGTYGTVFRGTLRDGTEVAVKLLEQPKEGGFREEVEVLSRFRHPNLVILLGFARNMRERYLIYEFLQGGDVHSKMEKDSASFQWKPRLSVSLDAALGLSHLHNSRPQVFHRDVKSMNILMDKNGTGKVADFGLACLAQPHQHSMLVSQAAGTIGYADPNYIKSGVMTERSEIYSFGMVLLEVLTGRPPALQHPNGSVVMQFDHVRGDMRQVMAMLDPRAKWPSGVVDQVGDLALRCIHESDHYRPIFVDVVTRLRKILQDERLHGQSSSSAAPRGQQDARRQYAAQQENAHKGSAGGQSAEVGHYRQGRGDATPGKDARGVPANPWAQHQQRSGGASGVKEPTAMRRNNSYENPFADLPRQPSGAAAQPAAAQRQRSYEPPVNRGRFVDDPRPRMDMGHADPKFGKAVQRPRSVEPAPRSIVGDGRAAKPVIPSNAGSGGGSSTPRHPSQPSNVGGASRPPYQPSQGQRVAQQPAQQPARYAQDAQRSPQHRSPGQPYQAQPQFLQPQQRYQQAGRQAAPPVVGAGEIVKSLRDLGIDPQLANEASRRYSSVEAACEWIYSEDRYR
mmetsp:Transcript_25428/g.58557  ORF Transcript_25428/g.58557 Transcript_25428/m.58557 type:complete len:602 (-) Transcript_25428:78-1883(-)